jgi:hypothetical protein
MCLRCLSLYQLPLKGFWKWPQLSETILTYLIPIVRIELAASMRICSPPSPSSSPSSSERWKSDQIIILHKKIVNFRCNFRFKFVAARALSPSSAFGESQRSWKYATTTQNGFWRGRSAGTVQAHRERRTCAQSSSEQGQGRLRPVLAGYYLCLITGQVGYQKIESSGYQFNW